jgi:hypothetical protein
MGGRIHDNHVLVDREHVAMRLDLSGDVVALGLEWQRRERPTNRIARGEGVGVFEGRHDLGIARDGNHAVVRFPKDGPVAAQVFEVLVGILRDGLIGEIVN